MKKVLIIEDEEAYIKLLRLRLAKSYEVFTANDGQKGLDLAIEKQPDLIILDIRMPIMDGIKMLKKLRQDTYGKTVNVILLTNLEPNESIIADVMANQPSYYLVKSNIKLDELITLVDELIIGGKPLAVTKAA